MKKLGKYSLKTYTSDIYSWNPNVACYNKGNKKYKKIDVPTPSYYCTAIPFSQGEDWTTTYVYDLSIINGIEHRIAYVECDYVQ
jgi:hypothetical protein